LEAANLDVIADRGYFSVLKGVLGGGAAGTPLSGGLNDLLKQLQQNGQANSWIGTGQNKAERSG
jgi:uncharacterized protein YidB (DUF937 family)